MSSPYEYEIWSRLQNYISSDYGIAGLMGNLYAESGLIPFRLQDDFSDGYVTSHNYTDRVDNGTYSRNSFTYDEKGYGLAQWTYYTRKEKLYDFSSVSLVSIGSLDRQISFLISELMSDYPSVWRTLNSATDIRTASNKVLHDFENPADQSEAVQNLRYDYSYNIYARNHGTPPTPPPPPTPPSPSFKGLPKWLMWKMANDRI